MKHKVIDIMGGQSKPVDMADKFFDAPWKPDLVHQVATVQAGNRRQGSAKVKDRGEVRGGGRKPWRQKGTGRARHGSTRSPIWVGGGVTHGPTAEKNYKRKLNVKMRRNALFSLLSEKLRVKEVLLVDSLEVASGKTKELARVIGSLPTEGKSTLLVLPTAHQGTLRAASNIPYLKAVQAKDLNVADVAASAYLVIPLSSLKVIEETFGS